MEVKGFRGTVFELEGHIQDLIKEAHPDIIKIKEFRMFPIDPKFETEFVEQRYDVLILFRTKTENS